VKRLVPILAVAVVGALWLSPPAQAGFGINSMSATAYNADGTVDLQAGSHPYEYTLSFAMNLEEEGNLESSPEGTLRSFVIDLPPGLIGNPMAIPRCPAALFEGQQPKCPNNTVIGVANVREANLGLVTIPLFNLVPRPGVPAAFGASLAGYLAFQEASLRTGGDYGVSVANIAVPTSLEIQSISATVWGVPGDPSHDDERGFGAIDEGIPASFEGPVLPFLTLPTSCTGPLKTTVSIESVQEPGEPRSESYLSRDDGDELAGLNGCERPPFEPTIAAQPETNAADSSTGLQFTLHSPQNQDPGGFGAANLKDSVITLPQGMSVNPSAADGLGACGPAQIDLKGPGPANCPENSKMGTVEVHTPLLDHPVKGAVYLAKQGDNPFNSLLALYIAVDDPQTGVVVKLAGKVEPDPVTGQLRTVFTENPQLPFEEFKVEFFGGPTGALTTPPTCGAYATTAKLTPWTTPEGEDVFPSDSFDIASGPSGPCAPTEAQLPVAPSFTAGTLSPLAGAYSPFVMKLGRPNGSRRFGAVNMTLPPGLTGKLAGVEQCSDAQLAVAASRNQPGDGALEKASPSCPAGSEVGAVTVGAGSGNPLYVQGKAYLAGPYRGAPLSLAIVTPAVAGPFDLGAVLVRAAAHVDPKTAQIRVKSDPIPQILEGIPLDVRSVAVNVSRERFTLNPTNCDPMSLGVEVLSALGQSTPLSTPFQVAGCRGLDFEPRFSLRLKGGTRRGANPKLIATVRAKEGEANIARASVKLPRSAFLDQAHIRTVCTRVQFAAEACPRGSIYGKATATTPLLDQPLTGDVYLRSSNNKLPDLVVDLRGPASLPIRIELAGRTDSVRGALRNTFGLVPDAPVSSFRLELLGGKRGLVVNSRNLCAEPQRATVKLRAHSGAAHQARPVVRNDCGKRALRSHRRGSGQ
jgi:hypothetical protein